MKPPSPFPNQTANHPIFAPESVGDGWRHVRYGELVKTHHQCYVLVPHPHWRLSAYSTHEGYHGSGRTTYREAASLRAWLTVLPGVAAKLWHRAIESLSKRRVG